MTLIKDDKPSIGFFELTISDFGLSSSISLNSDPLENQNEIIIGEPIIEIEGGELFLSSDSEDNVYFLTNLM